MVKVHPSLTSGSTRVYSLTSTNPQHKQTFTERNLKTRFG